MFVELKPYVGAWWWPSSPGNSGPLAGFAFGLGYHLNDYDAIWFEYAGAALGGVDNAVDARLETYSLMYAVRFD